MDRTLKGWKRPIKGIFRRHRRDDLQTDEQQLAYYSLLQRITASLHRSLDFDSILETVVTGLLHELKLSRCSVWFPDGAGELHIRKAAGQPTEGSGAGPVWLVAWDALADRRVVAADDVRAYGNSSAIPSGAGSLGHVLAEAAIAAPILLDAELKGLLILEAPHPRSWVLSNIRLIEAIAEQLSVALVHARMMASLKELDAMKTEFLSIASHELRTPITVIRGYAAVLLRHGAMLSEAERSEFIRMIDDRAEHLGRLVEDVLDVSRLEGGKLSLYPEPFEWEAMVQKLIQGLELKYHRPTNIHLTTLTKRQIVTADVSRVEQVMLNLLDNAIKYSPAHGRIDLDVRDTPCGIRFTVSNTGDVLAPEEVRRLTGKFVRLDRHRTVGGTGLGLYICRRLAERMGGILELDAIPTGGLRAAFELDCADDEQVTRR
jgi:signal transduction histidine kinase